MRQGSRRAWRSYHASKSVDAGWIAGGVSRLSFSGARRFASVAGILLNVAVETQLARAERGPSTVSYPSRPAAKPVAELIGKSLDPIVKKRGLARAELLAWWPDIVGVAYAGRTVPERIRWPRDGKAATLFVCCDPSLALQFQHEADRVRERLNSYFGYPAVGAIRIVQRPIGAQDDKPKDQPELEIDPALESRLDRFNGPLRDSFRALAKGVLARS
jgi:hypothetical protein